MKTLGYALGCENWQCRGNHNAHGVNHGVSRSRCVLIRHGFAGGGGRNNIKHNNEWQLVDMLGNANKVKVYGRQRVACGQLVVKGGCRMT